MVSELNIYLQSLSDIACSFRGMIKMRTLNIVNSILPNPASSSSRAACRGEAPREQRPESRDIHLMKNRKPYFEVCPSTLRQAQGDKLLHIELPRFLCLATFILCISLFTSCDLPHQPGPMPTEIVETEFVPGLNILGVLRADDQAGTSFINVNRALTTEEIYSDSIENFPPEVNYVKISSSTSGAEYLFIRGEDSSDWGDYRDTSLNVMAGGAFNLEIVAPGFPILTGSTMIPNKPQIVTNSLALDMNNLTFQIQHHTSAFEYKLYLFFPGAVLEKVVKPTNGNMIEVDWDFSTSNGLPLNLGLTALDENLTRYGNSPISIIPNTYHPDGSTVRGGYGCFGSVAVSIIEL